MRSPLLAAAGALLVAAVALSGCTLTDGGGGGRTGTFTRHILFSVNDAMESEEAEDGDDWDAFEDFLAEASEAGFTYRHEGAGADVAGLEVRFTDEQGRARERPLGSYTDLDRLEAGDTVDIDGVGLWSPIELVDGGSVLASRSGEPADWLRAGGYPLPLAAGDGASAEWELGFEFSLDASFDHAAYTESYTDYEYVCEPPSEENPFGSCDYAETDVRERTSVDDFSLAISVETTGTQTLTAEASDDGTELGLGFEADLEATALLDFLMETNRTDSSGSTTEGARYGTDASAELDLGLDATLYFDDERELEAFEGETSASADGHLYLWDEEHARGERYEPPFLSHPFFDFEESFGEDARFGEAIPELAAFLEGAWAASIAPGDELTLSLEEDEEQGLLFGFRYVVRVAAQEEVEVAGNAQDALRLEATVDLEWPGGGLIGPETATIDLLTLWVDAEDFTPLRGTTTYELGFDQEDLEPAFDLLALFASDEEIELPEEASVTLRFEASLEAASLEGDLRSAGALALAGALLLPSSIVLLPLAAVGAGYAFAPFGGYDEGYPEYEEAPEIGFSKNSAAATLTVVAVNHGQSLSWYELEVSGCVAPADGSVTVGDQLTGCEGSVTIAHWPTNTLVYNTEFSGPPESQEIQEADVALTFGMDATAGTLTVTSVGGQPDWIEINVYGCEESPFAGDILPGDEIVGCSGHVTVVHWTDEVRFFVGDFPGENGPGANDIPEILFGVNVVAGEGATLMVQQVANDNQAYWSYMDFGGTATCAVTSGHDVILVWDEVECTTGDFSIVHWPSGTVIFSATFS